ncbi:MAG: hypothetical protein WCZ23_03235 [Rhodospirillaceae bacterium]
MLTRVLVILVLAVIVGGGVFLATWDMPPPSAQVEKIIPNDRFANR